MLSRHRDMFKLAVFECKSWFYPLQYKTTNDFLSTHHSTPLFINFNKTCMFFIWLEPCRLCHIWELSKLQLILDPSCYHRMCLPVASSVINIGALCVMHADAQVFEAWVLAKKLWHVFHTAILKEQALSLLSPNTHQVQLSFRKIGMACGNVLQVGIAEFQHYFIFLS